MFKRSNKTFKIKYPLLIAFFVTAIWGLNVVAIKIGVTEVSPALFNMLRFGLLALLLIPFARIPTEKIKPVVGISLIMGIGHFYLLSVGTSYVDSNTAVILIMLGAPISSLLVFAFGMERLTPKQGLGVAVAFFGATMPLLLSGSVDLQIGALFIMVAMSAWALTNIYIRKLDNIPLLSLQFWIGLISTPVCLLAYFFEGNELGIWQQLNARVVSSVIYMVLFSSITAYSLWYATVNQHGINRVVSVTLLQPVFTMIFAYLLLQEVVSSTQLVGGIMTLAGIFIYYHRRSKKPLFDDSQEGIKAKYSKNSPTR